MNPNLQNNQIPLIDKCQDIFESLQMEVFGNIYFPSATQEVYNEDSIICNLSIFEEYALKAKEYLESLGYVVALFKDLKASKNSKTSCAFIYAKDMESLKEVSAYFLSNKEHKPYESMKIQDSTLFQNTQSYKRNHR